MLNVTEQDIKDYFEMKRFQLDEWLTVTNDNTDKYERLLNNLIDNEQELLNSFQFMEYLEWRKAKNAPRTKIYYFYDDSWYADPACDCCEGMWMDCFNIDQERHPDFVQNGSAYSIEGCMEAVLIHEGILEEGWVLPDDENSIIKGLMESNGLKIIVEGFSDE